MSAPRPIRDQLRDWVPWWLSDRKLAGKVVGFSYLWVMMAILDAYMQYTLEGLRAAWPGKGTPTALPYIGRSRGIIRGQADTDDTYAAKLRAWLDKWADAGTSRRLAAEIREYLGNAPRVRIVNRAGLMTTVAADGSISQAQCAWDWDSVSHPDRAGYWSEIWIIVYPTQWAKTTAWGSSLQYGGSSYGLGHRATRIEVDAIRGLVAQWKSAHTKVRAIVWTSDATLFNPASPGTLPNGSWGAWGTTGSGSRVASSRNRTTCRYWEM